MISVCTVTLDLAMPYFDIYLESLKTRTKLVSEVVIAKVDEPPSFKKEWSDNGIKFRMFGCMDYRKDQGLEHGLGMHACIDRATNDTLLFHDPDVFFYKPVDEFFYNLKQKYQLNVIGVSHCTATKFAYTFFPYLSCLMVNKSDLPDESFMKGMIQGENQEEYPGKYLIRMNPVMKNVFPNPEGDFDTGSYLWLWGHQQKWRWLAFQTLDVHTYTPAYNRGNVKVEKMGKEKLLYHVTSGTAQHIQPDIVKSFQQAWEDSKKGDGDMATITLLSIAEAI